MLQPPSCLEGRSVDATPGRHVHQHQRMERGQVPREVQRRVGLPQQLREQMWRRLQLQWRCGPLIVAAEGMRHLCLHASSCTVALHT